MRNETLLVFLLISSVVNASSSIVTWIFPFVNQIDPSSGADGYFAGVLLWSDYPAEVYLDSFLDGSFSTKITLKLNVESKFPDSYYAYVAYSNWDVNSYDKAPLIIRVPSNVGIEFWWLSNDLGIYDEDWSFSSPPLPGTKFYLPPIPGKLYVTVVRPGEVARVYYDNDLAGEVSYGKYLEIDHDGSYALLTSTDDVVVVLANYNSKNRDRNYVTPILPVRYYYKVSMLPDNQEGPLSLLAPDATPITKAYILYEDGTHEIMFLDSNAKLITLPKRAAIYVYYEVTRKDPWARAIRTYVGVEAIPPPGEIDYLLSQGPCDFSGWGGDEKIINVISGKIEIYDTSGNLINTYGKGLHVFKCSDFGDPVRIRVSGIVQAMKIGEKSWANELGAIFASGYAPSTVNTSQSVSLCLCITTATTTYTTTKTLVERVPTPLLLALLGGVLLGKRRKR